MKLPNALSKKVFPQKLQTDSDTIPSDIHDIPINALDGSPLSLDLLKGKYILFVNVASRCGFTKQYRDLERLYQKHKAQLMVIGVPCNQFGSQEPGSATQIKSFCETNFGVTFIMTEKVKVKGSGQHPLYQWLTKKRYNGRSNSSVRWNFQKYLVGPEGQLIDFYYSTTTPMSTKITSHFI